MPKSSQDQHDFDQPPTKSIKLVEEESITLWHIPVLSKYLVDPYDILAFLLTCKAAKELLSRNQGIIEVVAARRNMISPSEGDSEIVVYNPQDNIALTYALSAIQFNHDLTMLYTMKLINEVQYCRLCFTITGTYRWYTYELQVLYQTRFSTNIAYSIFRLQSRKKIGLILNYVVNPVIPRWTEERLQSVLDKLFVFLVNSESKTHDHPLVEAAESATLLLPEDIPSLRILCKESFGA